MTPSLKELYRKYVHDAVLACNNGAGLHPKDVDRLRAAICQTIYEALNTPATPKLTPTTAATWTINDNNDALWQITITDYATYATTTHYLLAEGDVLGPQDLLNLCYHNRAILAAALNLPATTGINFDLVGLLYLGLVNIIG